MLSAVVLVFREVLEAAFIFSLLLAATHKLQLSRTWSLLAFTGGVIGSWLLSNNARMIAQALDGSGQEILNCLLFLGIIVSIIAFIFMISPQVLSPSSHIKCNRTDTKIESISQHRRLWIYSFFVIAVTSAITREGSEIWIYLSSFNSANNTIYPILLGGAIGAGIGLSIGAIAYYLLIFIPPRIFYITLWTALTLMVGGLATQVAKELMQIGFLESSQPLWNSSWLISEHSLVGEFLHALINYEAKPTAVQVYFFLAAITPIFISLFRQLIINKKTSRATQNLLLS